MRLCCVFKFSFIRSNGQVHTEISFELTYEHTFLFELTDTRGLFRIFNLKFIMLQNGRV